MKKLLALLLVSVMTLALLAGCGGGNNQTPADSNSGQTDVQTPSDDAPTTPPPTEEGGYPVITWYMVGSGQPANISSWTEKANAYLEEKIGVHINVQCIEWGPWGQRRSVIVQTNEPYDIMFTDASTYANDVKMGAFADLTDLLAQTPGIAEAIPADFLDAARIGDRIYGIPAYKDSAAQQFFVWTKEQVDAYYPDWANVHTTEQATAALKARRRAPASPPCCSIRTASPPSPRTATTVWAWAVPRWGSATATAPIRLWPCTSSPTCSISTRSSSSGWRTATSTPMPPPLTRPPACAA